MKTAEELYNESAFKANNPNLPDHDKRDVIFLLNQCVSQFHPSPKENECRHNMFSVYSLNNFDSGGKSSWGLHKCAQCGKEESWQYDHV